MDFNPLQRNPQIYITLGENHMTEKRKLEPSINIKSSELVSRKLKKTCDLNDLSPEPTIQSCDTGHMTAVN